MKHFTTFLDYTSKELSEIVSRALELKRGAGSDALRGKILALLFLNPSLRTRVSFESALARFGGHSIFLAGTNDVRALETKEGAVMNSSTVEHVKDAARVLSRYCDAIAIRTFAEMKDFETDMRDEFLTGFKKHATVPVISMESASEHPCQALADMATMTEKLGDPKRKRFVLTWVPHVKPLPMAVPHSALLAGASLGMHVTLACPKGYELSKHHVSHVAGLCEEAGTTFSIEQDQKRALSDADVIYAKAWGNPSLYGNFEAQAEELAANSSWMISDVPKESILMHCLPVRRNVEVKESVLDSSQSVIIDQAENRLWAQTALLEALLSSRNPSTEL